jgi:hypothetical protein
MAALKGEVAASSPSAPRIEAAPTPAANPAPATAGPTTAADSADTMVVRIQGEDQYRLNIAERPQLEPLDNALSAAIEQQNSSAYTSALGNLLNFVRSHGVKLAPDALEGSDVMLPSEDMTIEEATALLAGNGNVVDAPASPIGTPAPGS